MGESDFEIIEHAFDVPFRTRNVNAGHIAFRAGDLDVYVMADVASRARQWAGGALPRETGGLLAGRILRDNAGQYVVVTGIACAPAGAGGMGRFSLSPEETDQLRRALARDHPSADVIGWWHSHTAPSVYSATDRANQAIWTDPRHVGLLVFAQGTPWAALYAGPQSRGPFQPHGPVAALDRQPPGGNLPESYRPEPSSPAGGDPPSRAGGDPGARRRLTLAALIAVVAVAIIALAVKAFQSTPPSKIAVPSVIGSIGVSGSGDSLPWSCTISPHGTTPIARCSVDPQEAVQSIKWYENESGKVRATGKNATLYLLPGANVVWVAITYVDDAQIRKYQMNLSVQQ